MMTPGEGSRELEESNSLKFSGAGGWFSDVGSEAVARLIASSADVALVIDACGTVSDVSTVELGSHWDMPVWTGRLFSDVVGVDSKLKAEALVREATPSGPGRSREINLLDKNDADIPVRFTAIRIGNQDRVLALGRDLRSVSSMQQKLVRAQNELERDYGRIRSAEARYRLLFQRSEDPLFILDVTEDIAEANASAIKMFGKSTERLIKRPIASIFEAENGIDVRKLLATALSGGHGGPVRARLAVNGAAALVTASTFREYDGGCFLVRVKPVRAETLGTDIASHAATLLTAINLMPEGFAMLDRDQRLLLANDEFASLTEVTFAAQMTGSGIERWIGNTEADTQILMRNLKENGYIRQFTTVVRSQYGGIAPVELTGVATFLEAEPRYVLLLRAARAEVEPQDSNDGFRSVGDLMQLVGQLSLKQLVTDATDIVERLCIEAALKRTSGNRASAAQILGLSRQSLYSKLNRHMLIKNEYEASAS